MVITNTAVQVKTSDINMWCVRTLHSEVLHICHTFTVVTATAATTTAAAARRSEWFPTATY